ncbi:MULTISPECIES: ParA family protein [unclassified Ensifer]|uniref:ParA family protein n=1 Tax=unclassified Ensifer TaxID=2633371 RepID=UPI000812D9A9|nr:MULTISPECIES: ParA family protein [unclassified Ensifer]OCP09365.1 chromosome partitioning protein ParA [Ensifer sp. LC13]OCP10544.1 chromosome partitioning protein ParA [Ensifer sp. LC11]OCP11699.1 chromosome partitioning protein ParA [Ensifer sp. LC14]OCP32613.1 chromosome partitioning protein ParA [Ensifer sp. LC499]
MAIVSLANAKGGAGKTTAALLLACEFARRGDRVAVLDCDPLACMTDWFRHGRNDDRLSITSGVTTSTLSDHLRRLRGQVEHVVIDLSGAADVLVALAIGLSDLTLIPVQGCVMDARGAIQVLELIRYIENNARADINHAVLLTRVNPIVTTRAMRTVKLLLAESRIRLVDTPLVERTAFRELFEQGDTLYSLDANRVSNLAKAQVNAQAFANDVLRLLSPTGEAVRHGPFSSMCYRAGRTVEPVPVRV